MKTILSIILSLLVSSQVFAEDGLTMVGTSEQSISVTHANTLLPQGLKEVKVIEYELSDTLQEQLYQQAQRRLSQTVPNIATQNSSLPKKVQLGMANVPVLDQGLHGTCSAFAVTAAVDALLKRGHYVSELCLLQLGNYLHDQQDGPSGWDGGNGERHLSRIKQYGIISMANQHLYGCGGYRLYPAYYFTPSNGMSPNDYAQMSNSAMTKNLKWKTIDRSPYLRRDIASTLFLQQIKMALHSGSRLVVSMLLPKNYWYSLGATGKYHFWNDTWVLTSDIAEELKHEKRMAGHEMVLTGYDDTAKALDSAGHVHQGLFKVRSSWSALVGDWGDFYISYDYAEILLHEGIQLSIQD